MADPQIDLVKIRNAELARRGLGAAQGISDFAAPVRDTLYSGIANPLAYLKDMSLAGLSGIYGAASDISGFGASALGAPELGKQLFSQADESYGSAMTRLKGALPGVPDISGFGPQDMQDIFSDENLGIPAFDVKMPATDRSGKVSSSAGALGSKVIPSNVQGGRGEDPRAQIAKDKTAIEELMGNNNNDAGAGIVQPPEVSKVPDAADELYKSSYEEYIKGFLTPDVAADPDSLEKYKQDFAKATGLDISGKPDTRSAAAAFGFALMQNRAGKGFNVGRMLESVGQAGDKAAPYLNDAYKEAKNNAAIAGKYALDKVKADEDASAAIAASNRSIKSQFALAEFKAQKEIEVKILEASLEGNTLSMPESVYTSKISIGGKEIEIRKGLDPKTGRSVFVDAPTDIIKIGQAYNRTRDGLNSIKQMREINDLMQEKSANLVGGFTGKMFYDRVGGVLTSMGISSPDQFFKESEKIDPSLKGMSLESSAEIMRRALLLRFKRFISQETGNGISNVDWEVLNTSSGKYSPFTNPNESVGALNELEKLFTDSMDTLEPLIEQFDSPKSYQTYNSQDNYLYTEASSLLEKTLSQPSWVKPTANGNGNGLSFDVRKK